MDPTTANFLSELMGHVWFDLLTGTFALLGPLIGVSMIVDFARKAIDAA